MLNILAVGEMQIKSVMNYHYRSIRIAKISTIDSTSKCWRARKATGTLTHAWWNANLCLGTWFGNFL